MKRNKFSRCVLGAALIAFSLSIGLVPAGCDSDDGTPAELIALWQLQEFIVDGTATPVDDPAKYTIDFQDDGSVAIVSDCNRCSGTYSVDGSRLSFGPLACTVAACLPGSLDGQFQLALSSVSRFEITDGSLFLRHDGGEMRLTPAPALFQ